MTDEISSHPVQIKGVREGLLVTLGEGLWTDLRDALFKQVGEGGSFFQGARIALDVGPHALRAAELGSLRDALSERGISLWAVISTSATTEQNAQVLGMATRLSTPRAERTVRPVDTPLTGESAIFIQKTLRSGNKVAFAGHVVVLGDVNPGAEIQAGGNVVVWGHLRGSVHAGSDGNEGASVCALDMDPTQLRIANTVAATFPHKGKSQPEFASVQDGQIVAESWNPKRK